MHRNVPGDVILMYRSWRKQIKEAGGKWECQSGKCVHSALSASGHCWPLDPGRGLQVKGHHLGSTGITPALAGEPSPWQPCRPKRGEGTGPYTSIPLTSSLSPSLSRNPTSAWCHCSLAWAKLPLLERLGISTLVLIGQQQDREALYYYMCHKAFIFLMSFHSFHNKPNNKLYISETNCAELKMLCLAVLSLFRLIVDQRNTCSSAFQREQSLTLFVSLLLLKS